MRRMRRRVMTFPLDSRRRRCWTSIEAGRGLSIQHPRRPGDRNSLDMTPHAGPVRARSGPTPRTGWFPPRRISALPGAGERFMTQRTAETLLRVERSTFERERTMSDERQQFDRLIGHMKRQLASGRMTYVEAVIVDDLISILEDVRSRAAQQPGAVDRRHRGSSRNDPLA